jgi:N-acetylmuramoyl-L-alanine amidase
MNDTPLRPKGLGRARCSSIRPGIALVAIAMGALPLASGAQTIDGGGTASASIGNCDGRNFRTVLDVGHSIEASGATSARGVSEYVFNLRLAKQIEQSLLRAGFAKVYLLVTRGVGRSTLMQRSARSNELVADLFISIHHDSVQDSYLQKWTYQGKVQQYSDKFRGYSIFVSYENAQPKASLEAAEFLGDQLQAMGLRFTGHHAENINGERRQLIDDRVGIYRYDNLVVLRNTIAPAMLLEAGVIVNRDEESLLATAAYQETISSAVAAAVERFCVSRSSYAREADPNHLPPNDSAKGGSK